MIQELKQALAESQARQAALEERIRDLEELQSLTSIPDWAAESVSRAVKAGLLQQPEGGSYDFYRVLTILHRKGLF
ncbi:hypothetical protein N6H14_22780 [Paenibacillus sp. CC-CFT747]|nr:hypothetical protein N6H14_22780 [Paenibacillus sp. CC-CFT747]